jgi:sugar lactone lactonase YvrE
MRLLNRFFIVVTVAGLAAMVVPISAAGSDVSDPQGLALDGNGNLFVADSGTGTILKFTPEGNQSTFASGLVEPYDLAFDGKGNLFVADFYGTGADNSWTILKFTPEGTRSTFASGPNAPIGLAFDAAGNLFVADKEIAAIFKFSPDGTKTSFASGLSGPLGLTFDKAGNLFVSDTISQSIYKFTSDGTKTSFADGLGVPMGLAFDKAGNLFVSDRANQSIFKFTSNGTRSTFASRLKGPSGLAFDKVGNLFVSDQELQAIFKFAPNGTRSTFHEWIWSSVSPDKKWEYRSLPVEDEAKIVKAGTSEVAVDFFRAKSGTTILWAPDSKRVALNYGNGRGEHLPLLYQLRGEVWVALKSPGDRDKVSNLVKADIAAQVKREGLPKKTQLRLNSWTVKVHQWVDSSTAILYASMREEHEADVEADFLFTLKFDESGNWKIVKTHRMSEKEVEKFRD